MAKREIKLDISQTSLNKFDALFKKFNIKWDEKVFKSTDKLSDRIKRLNESVMLWNRKIEESRLRTANQAIKDFDAGKGVSGKIPEFDTSKLEGSFERLAKAIEDATEKMGDMQKGTEDLTSLTFDQRRTIIDDIKQRELGRLQVMREGKEIQHAHRKEMENLHAKHQMEKKAAGSWEESLGSLGSLVKNFFTYGDEMMKPFTDIGNYQNYMGTGEGQNAMMNYEKAQSGGSPTAGLEQGAKMQQEGGFGGNIESMQKKSSGFMGKAMGKIGNMFGAGKEGGVGGIMKGLGGAKGMMAIGGAMASIKIIQKGVQLAIASSPMMQQMLKLWKFGIMMIFRPLGDFFGFFLRPIFVMLLRKFIIPFYQTYLPMMQELGQKLGEDVANGIMWILETLMGIRYVLDWSYRAEVDAARQDERLAGTLHADLGKLVEGTSYSMTGEEKVPSPRAEGGTPLTESELAAAAAAAAANAGDAVDNTGSGRFDNNINQQIDEAVDSAIGSSGLYTTADALASGYTAGGGSITTVNVNNDVTVETNVQDADEFAEQLDKPLAESTEKTFSRVHQIGYDAGSD